MNKNERIKGDFTPSCGAVFSCPAGREGGDPSDRNGDEEQSAASRGHHNCYFSRLITCGTIRRDSNIISQINSFIRTENRNLKHELQTISEPFYTDCQIHV